jgi:quercetin dioxygenase-like cupin family protein
MNTKTIRKRSPGLFLLLIIGIGGGYVMATEAGKTQSITRAGTQAPVKGSAAFFTGNVRVEPLFAPKEGAAFSGAYVTFEPGARSFWHTHPAGQHLLVTAGVGRTGTWDESGDNPGGKVEEIRAGDVVWCPPGVKHWHGASPTSAMTHIALTGSDANGKNVEWLEAVTEAQFLSGGLNGKGLNQ